MNIQEQLLNIEKEAVSKIELAVNQVELNDLRAFYMGKKSPLAEIMKSMATLSTIPVMQKMEPSPAAVPFITKKQ